MDRYVLVITPVRADPAFGAKMEIVRAQCRALGIGYRVPETNPGKFDLDAALAAIRGAALILADLSYARASCYYELGLVEGAGRRAMLLAETGTEIFQHSGRDAVAFYDDLTAYEALIVRTLARVPRAI
jgi:hypothetical protein